MIGLAKDSMKSPPHSQNSIAAVRTLATLEAAARSRETGLEEAVKEAENDSVCA